MLYARIYKLGNFLDYCNHLQNWLSQCGIGRFQQWSLTTGMSSNIYTHCSLKEKPLHCYVILHLKVNYALQKVYWCRRSHIFKGKLHQLFIDGSNSLKVFFCVDFSCPIVCNLLADSQDIHLNLQCVFSLRSIIER